MKTYKFKKTITKQEVDEIMQQAIHAITYWADGAELKENTECLIPLNELLTNDFRIRIHDSQADKWHTLTMKKFLRGLEQMPHHNYIDYDEVDADMVIQYALFGKVRYS